MVKKPPASVRDTRDMGLIPVSGRSPGGGNATSSSICAWRIPWTEEPGRLQSMGITKSQTQLKQLSFSLQDHIRRGLPETNTG